MFKSWEKILIKNEAGEVVEASAPIIISASRATDIPAFYSSFYWPEKVEQDFKPSPDRDYIIEFIRKSERGIIRAR